jgi:1-acyl-sn-glycerol-3-phosphate acyltransferase
VLGHFCAVLSSTGLLNSNGNREPRTKNEQLRTRDDGQRTNPSIGFMIRALFVTLIALAYILLVGTPILIRAAISGNTDILYRAGRFGAGLVLWLSGVKLEVIGRDKTRTDRAVIFMSNHQSNCDPPAVFNILPPVLIIGKKQFFRVPILGHGMALRGFIPIDRKNRAQAIEAIEAAIRALKAGHSFLIYPEGTRSPDGRLQAFKKGAFVMAIKAGAPIVPISISGSGRVMPKGKFEIHPGVVRITVHDAVPTEGCLPDDRDRIMELVRQAISSGLSEDELPVPA